MMFFVLAYQVCMFAFFQVRKKYSESYVLGGFIIITLIYWLFFVRGKVFRLEDMEKST